LKTIRKKTEQKSKYPVNREEAIVVQESAQYSHSADLLMILVMTTRH
jgi:hypothetical protein